MNNIAPVRALAYYSDDGIAVCHFCVRYCCTQLVILELVDKEAYSGHQLFAVKSKYICEVRDRMVTAGNRLKHLTLFQ